MNNNNNDNKIYKPIDNVVKNNLLDQIQKYFRVEMLTAMKIYDICECESVKELQKFLHISEEEAIQICEIISNYIKNGKCILHVFPKEIISDVKEPENKDISDKEIEFFSKKYKISIQEIKTKIEQIKQEFKDSNFDDFTNDDILNQVNYFYESTAGKYDKKPKKSEQIWAVADEIAKLDIISMTESRKLFKYDAGIYVSQNVEEEIKEVAATQGYELFETCFLDRDINNVIYRIHYKKRHSQLEFNKDKNIIVVENGLVDINTGELRPHTPDEIYTHIFNFSYDPDAKLTPEFDYFLKTVFKGVEYQIDIAQEFFGFCLTDEYFIQAFLYMLGGGGNGKGTFLNILKEFIGVQYTSAVPLDDICGKDKFTLASLYNMKLNVCGDISPSIIKKTDNLKKATGRDLIWAQFKYGQPFNFPNTAKIAFAGNKSVVFDDDSKGFIDRLILMDFPNRFRNTKNDDQDMEKKCTTPESLSGILTWAIAGLKRLREQKMFSHQKSYEEKLEMLNKKTNPIEFFVKECLVESPNNWISNDSLFKMYTVFAKKHNLPDILKKTFITDLKGHLAANGIVTDDIRKTLNKETKYCISNIQFSTKGTSDLNENIVNSAIIENFYNARVYVSLESVTFTDMYNAYIEWCEETKMTPLDMFSFLYDFKTTKPDIQFILDNSNDINSGSFQFIQLKDMNLVRPKKLNLSKTEV